MPGYEQGKKHVLKITINQEIYEKLLVSMAYDIEDSASKPIQRAIDYRYKSLKKSKRNELREKLGLPLLEEDQE